MFRVKLMRSTHTWLSIWIHFVGDEGKFYEVNRQTLRPDNVTGRRPGTLAHKIAIPFQYGSSLSIKFQACLPFDSSRRLEGQFVSGTQGQAIKLREERETRDFEGIIRELRGKPHPLRLSA